MEDQGTPREDLVRCLACGRIYALPVRSCPGDGVHGCTECGEVSWIALTIPTRTRSGPTPGVGRAGNA